MSLDAEVGAPDTPPPAHSSSVRTDIQEYQREILALAALDVPVFPCKPDKSPYTPHGLNDATTDPDQIRAWWERWPDALVGMPTGATSKIDVVDLDVSRNGKPDGTVWLRDYEDEHGPVRTLRATTPSGGQHLYFARGDRAVRSRNSWVAPHVDIKGDGGYVITSPSPGYEYAPGIDAPQPPPAALLDLIAPVEVAAPPAPAPLRSPHPFDGIKRDDHWMDDLEAEFCRTHTWDWVLDGVFVRLSGTEGRYSEWRFIGQENEKGATTDSRGTDTLHVHSGSAHAAGWPASPSSLTKFGAYVMVRTGRTNIEARTAVARELAGRAQPTADNAPPDDSGPEAGTADRSALLEFKKIPDPFALTPMRWHVVGLVAEGTHGEIAGEKKSLKSYIGTSIVIGATLGVPVLGEFAVPAALRTLVLVGEGGEDLFLRRVARIAAAYGATVDDVRDGMLYTVQSAPASSARFRDSVAAALDVHQPDLVLLDPWYAYAANEADARNLYETGAVLNDLREQVCNDGASLALANHFNKTGSGRGLERITMAGHAEWCDSWWLVDHRQPPDVAAGSFRLRMDVGSRQWGGATWQVDYSLGEFDQDLGEHVGDIAWNVHRGHTDSDSPETSDTTRVLLKCPEVVRVCRETNHPLLVGDIKQLLKGSSPDAGRAIGLAVDAGCLKREKGDRTGKLHHYVRDWTHDDAEHARRVLTGGADARPEGGA